MIRIFAVCALLLSIAACAPVPTDPNNPPVVVNELTINTSTSVTYVDGQRPGEHRHQQLYACYNENDIYAYLDGQPLVGRCGIMEITTAEDWGSYRGHHITSFIVNGWRVYAANPIAVQPRPREPSMNEIERMVARQCRDWYPGNYRAQVDCMMSELDRIRNH
jgi:hypothetical protein